ncbi:hypothetical protein ACP4OV_003023 [Aristida adscensionis]
MPPPRRRPRLSSRPYAAAVAAEPRGARGWLAVRRGRPAKRARRAAAIARADEDDGTPLTDEILVVRVFATLPDLADLVRCAATCRRWRRLVSAEAAFICGRRRPPAPPSFARSLALGFFYLHRAGAVPRFAPMASASRRLALRQPCSLNALVEGLDDGLFDAARVVASRGGLVAVELRRGKRERALKLCICNPMTGEFAVLPPLSGRDSLNCYACAILTDADADGAVVEQKHAAPSSSYRLVLVYRRRGFTACRSYSSDGGAWGPEAKVSGGLFLGGKEMAAMAAAGAGVAAGGKVFWLTRGCAFGLDLATMQAEVVRLPQPKGQVPAGSAVLAASPDGRSLRAVQVVETLAPTAKKPTVAIAVHTRRATGGGWEEPAAAIEVARQLPEEAFVKLRCACERSGVVFFAAWRRDHQGGREVYAVSVDKGEVEKVAGHHGGGGGGGGGGRWDPAWEDLHGYEMDQVSYLASLAVDDDDDGDS